MKTLRQFMTSLLVSAVFASIAFSAVDPGTVSTYATDPALPLIDQAVTIYVNVNHFGITNIDTVTAYTGTVTTASDSKTGWRNVKNSDWSDISVEMTKENDSVYSLQIPDINVFYGVPATEEVVRITFIARGTKNKAVSGQTSDLFIDVFAADPTTVFSYLPTSASDKDMVVVTWNINDTDTPSRNDLEGYADTTYVHTWGHGTLGAIVGPGWGENTSKWMCDAVNDSIRRFYFAPTVRGLFEMGASATVDSIGILIRNKEANGQTNDFVINLSSEVEVDLADVDPILMVPEFPTQNDPVYVYLDAKNYMRGNGDTLDPASIISAWSGLVTSASSDKADWLHQVNADWGGFGDSTLFERVNDSIHRWAIPSFTDKYGVDLASEDVFRLAIIARDTAGGGINNQTDDIYLEVYGDMPTDTTHTIQPAMITENDAFVITFNPENVGDDNNLFPLLDTNMVDTIGVWAHTGVTLAQYSDDVNDWQNVLTEWGTNTDETKAVVVSSNVVRFFVFPETRTMYDVGDELNTIALNILLRNEAGNAQTADLVIPFDTTGYNLMATPGSGIDNATILEGVSVYPNPVNDVLTISFEEAQTATVTFINAVGQVVYVKSIQNENNTTINVAEFATKQEILFYTIKSDNKIVTGKLLVY